MKYKKCHEGKDAAKPTRSGLLTTVLLGVLVVGGAVAVVIGFARGGGAARAGGRPGQVWSPEHGHWHDAPRELPPGLGVTAVPVPVTAPVVVPTP